MNSPTSWLNLTDDQCRMLVEAFEETPLVVVLMAFTPTDEAHLINRRHRYVGLVQRVSLELLDAGLVTVWEHPEDGVGEGGLLFPDDARTVLSDSRNWWTFDPDDEDDPEITDTQRREGLEWEWRYSYDLMPTSRASELQDLDQDDRVHALVKPRIRATEGW